MDAPIDFVILGAQKAGTTTLHEVLHKHPRIAMPASKESPVLNLRGMTDQAAHARLEALFPEPSLLRGKASPQYLASPRAAGLLHRIAPQVRLIAILRDPVERTFSHYRMVQRRAGRPLDFERDVARWLEPEALAHARSADHEGREDELPFCVAWSEYGRMLQPYVDRFGRDALLLLHMEDLQRDPRSVFARILAFLGLDPDWSSSDIGKAFHRGGDRPLVDLKRIRRIPVLGATLKALFPLVPARLRLLIDTKNIRSEAKSARDLHPRAAALLDAHFASDQAHVQRLEGLEP